MPAGRTAGPGSHCNSAGVTSLLSIVWVMKHSFRSERNLAHAASEEIANDRRDLRATTLQSKMAGIEQMDFRLWVVAFERFRASRQKERIVLAPHRKKRRLLCTKVVLEFWVERDVALIVSEQIQLDLVIAGPGKQRRVEGPGIGRKPFRFGCAVRVLPLRGLWRQEGAQG